MLVPHMPVGAGQNGEEMEITLGELAPGFFKRTNVIQHEQAATVRGHNQVVILLDEFHVVDRRRGKVRLECSPMSAIIARIEQAAVGAQNQESLPIWILAHYTGGIVRRETRRNRCPGLAAIVGLEDVWLVVFNF